MPGTLFVVATPIGNLEDITLRALRTLREVDAIAAEDTRRTAKLLAHFEIRKPLISLHEHNEDREAPRLVRRLLAGESIALVSDAGTPGIADPGARLVSVAREQKVAIVPVPGPSAVAAALSVSGFSASEFVFMGFPPRSGAQRLDWLERLAADDRIVVAFEAPHRVRRTLAELKPRLGKRPILISREITKVHEHFVLRPMEAVIEHDLKDIGEFVLVFGAKEPVPAALPDERNVAALIGLMTENLGIDTSTALELLGRGLRQPTSSLKKSLKLARYGSGR